ncbi:hypothetical protein SPHINGOT1_120031 [Sphingomonas sp. T1]|nr:hypothetical protein SPHINGOT1_120031 [Sphingomonas sp. T1]
MCRLHALTTRADAVARSDWRGDPAGAAAALPRLRQSGGGGPSILRKLLERPALSRSALVCRVQPALCA